MAVDKNKFIPIKGPEESILAIAKANGNIYFATDTGNIYLDISSTERISIGGGGIAIFYAADSNVTTNPEDSNQYLIELDNISNASKIKINDLILNTTDGSFYRVLTINDDDILCERLSISGSGSGGSGGGTTSLAQLKVNYYPDNASANKNALYQADCNLQCNITATDTSGETASNGSAVIYVNNIEKATVTASNGLNTINVGEYLSLGSNTIKIKFNFDVGEDSNKVATKSWTVNTHSINLSVTYDETTINNINNNFTLNWEASGQVSKQLHMSIDDDAYEYISNANTLTTQQTLSINPSEYGLSHGGHELKFFVSAIIDDETIETEPIYKQAIFVDSTSESPIISYCLPNLNLTQYDTTAIPIIIYNPAVEEIDGTSTVVLKEEGIVKDTWTAVPNKTIQNWNYTPVVTGETTLTLICGNTEKNIVVNISALNINNEEISGYAFKFKATDFASNEAVRNWNNNNVSATFSDNFDWINGGLKSETLSDGTARQYFCVKAGTTMTIGYDLFNTNAFARGKNVKIIFKATNCRDYDAQAIKCYDDTKNIGLIVKAQNATVQTAQDSLITNYYEDSYLEYEFDVWPSVSSSLSDGTDTSERYIIGWLDGVPCGATVYQANDTITYTSNQNIVVGSEQCDVYLYMFKVYETHLSDASHLANFIADAPNATEMLARYNRNDILDDLGEISPTKLATKNPNCYVHLYDIDHMTTNKDTDPVAGCTYTQYHGSSSASLSAENVTIKVQGTSSAAYGIAAFNIDSDFKDGFTNADGTHSDGWAMDDDAIPVSYFTTKVNVASCENGNNAVNQEWYNRFQPYKCAWRKKNSKGRDTMEFKPGVLFIKDHNQTTNTASVQDNVFKDTNGYVANPYYKLYSVCNMGNSKKNLTVFHDAENSLECCIEVTDNQKAGQWLSIPQGYHKETVDGAYVPFVLENIDTTDNYAAWQAACTDNNYDFRYPKKPSETMYRNFYTFVNWMAHNDLSPKYISLGSELTESEFTTYTTDHVDAANNTVEAIVLYKIENDIHVAATTYVADTEYFYIDSGHIYGYTNEPLAAPVTFESYTFTSSDYTSVLGGLTITDFAGTYTTDSYEYRMAKMLSECEQHLIMDAMVFHYLFIERHTMIDNVAKNTFWCSEDLQHWSLIKDYDNDTADGNDNEGKLSLTYGYEAQDKISDRYVFNAHGTVWFNFINGLYPACEKMYIKLAEQGAWDPDTYLTYFEEFQSAVPERCWIESYYRTYLRPRKVYGADDYIDMLEGGKKTHQRRQFEEYQNYYMNSKYTYTGDSESIFFRANTQNMQNDYNLPVKVYCDCYVKSSIGQQKSKTRVTRNSNINILFDHTILGSMNDATCLLYSGFLYTELGDMSPIKPKELRISAAKRLQKLIVGKSQSNDNLESIALGANTMLEKLEICKCTNSSLAALDLSSAIGLEYLDLRESTFTGLTLADGAPIKELYLGDNLKSLQFANLTEVESFSMNSYDQINQLFLTNIDANEALNSKTLVDESDNLEYYKLNDVAWTIDDATEFTDNQINILERLKTLNPSDEQKNTILKAAALTGTLTITADAYNGEDSFAIYNQYAKNDMFPGLEIKFEGANAKLHTIYVYNGNNELSWHRSIAQNAALTTDFLTTGPNGAYTTALTYKSDNEQYTYSFANNWKIYSDSALTNQIGTYADSLIADTDTTILDNVTSDIYLIPEFTSNIRTYQVKFYNYDDTLLKSITVDYGTTLSDCLPTTIPCKAVADTEANLAKVYNFLGYGLTATTSTLVDTAVAVKRDYEHLYAIYTSEPISVYSAIHEDWFNYTTYSYNEITSQGGDTSNNATGYLVTPKSGLTLTGKITIPAQNPDKTGNVIAIGGFQNSQVTHVFFEENSTIKEICDYTFSSTTGTPACTTLKHFEFISSIRSIGSCAFRNTQLTISGDAFRLPDNCYRIASRAFLTALYSSSPITIIIGPEVTMLGYLAFGNLQNLATNSKIMIGNSENKSKLNLTLNDDTSTLQYKRFTADTPVISQADFYTDLYTDKTEVVYTYNNRSYTVEQCFIDGFQGATYTVDLH